MIFVDENMTKGSCCSPGAKCKTNKWNRDYKREEKVLDKGIVLLFLFKMEGRRREVTTLTRDEMTREGDVNKRDEKIICC